MVGSERPVSCAKRPTPVSAYWTLLTVACGLAFNVQTVGAQWSGTQDSRQPLNWNSRAFSTPAYGVAVRSPVISSVSMQPAGSLIAVAGDNHVVSLFDTHSDQFVRFLDHHRDWIRAARFSPDGRWLVTCGNDRQIIKWDTSDFDRPIRLARVDHVVVDVAFSSDSRQLAAVGFDRTVRIYDLETEQEIQVFTGPCDDLRAVAFSPDDRWLATGGRNGIIRIWDAASGDRLKDIEAHRGRIRSLEFADPQRLVSCGEDRQVKLIDVERPDESFELPQYGGKLFAVKVLGSGLLASGGSDNRIYIWDLERMSKLGSLHGHTGTVTCLDYQSGQLVSGSYDTQIRIWTAEKIAELIESIRR